MIALELPLLMVLPIVLEVATRAQRAQPQHGLGAFKAPPSPGDFHAIADDVAARPFDFPRLGSRDAASRNASSMTSSGSFARLAHTRLPSGRGRGRKDGALSGRNSRMRSSAVRTNGAIVYTAATWAIRLTCRFSPLVS